MKRWFRKLLVERRRYGWRGLLKKRGWRLVLAVVLFYLVRDVVLYVLIPYLVYLGVVR